MWHILLLDFVAGAHCASCFIVNSVQQSSPALLLRLSQHLKLGHCMPLHQMFGPYVAESQLLNLMQMDCKQQVRAARGGRGGPCGVCSAQHRYWLKSTCNNGCTNAAKESLFWRRLIASSKSGQQKVIEGDAVVFAVGVKAMQGITAASPDLLACPVGILSAKICTCLLHTHYNHVAAWIMSSFASVCSGGESRARQLLQPRQTC